MILFFLANVIYLSLPSVKLRLALSKISVAITIPFSYTVCTGHCHGRVHKEGGSAMGYLPIPVDMYFEDFAMEVLEYNVLNNNNVIGTYQGLSNSDEDGTYIGFKMSDQPLISVGNTLCTVDGLEEYQIIKVSYDRYEGKPELLKAYY
jgi:hypothetical protein